MNYRRLGCSMTQSLASPGTTWHD